MQEESVPVLHERNFKVKYDEINEKLWKSTAEVEDDLHHIKTWLEISVPDLIVKDAGIEFVKMPFEECNLIKEKAKKLIGTPVQKLGFKIYCLFLGDKGCANVYLLFSLSGPAFDNIYQLNLVSQNKMTQEQYNVLMKNDCIAHKEVYKKGR